MDPFDVTEHITAEELQEQGIDAYEGCSEELWLDEEAGVLLPLEEIAGRGCSACVHARSIWEKIIEDCGSHEYGHAAFRAMSFEAEMLLDPSVYFDLDLEDQENVRAIMYERKKLEAQRSFNQQREAEQRSKQRG